MSQLISLYEKHKVYVTTVAPTGLFYVQLDCPNSCNLPSFSKDISVVINSNVSKNRGFSPSLGTKCFARSLSSNKWCRGLVVNVDSPITCTIYYLDYGNTEGGVPISQLFPPIAQFFEMPYQAIQCQLANFLPNGGAWSPEIVSALSDNILNQEVPAVFHGESPDHESFLTKHEVPCYLATLYWEESDDSYTVADEMVAMAMGTYPSESPENILSVPKSKPPEEKCPAPPTPGAAEATPTNNEYNYLSLEVGLEYKLYVSYSESPDVIWGHFSERTKELDQLVTDLQETLSAERTLIIEEEELAPSQPCCVLYSDGNWCRGLIEEWEEETLVAKVLFVDYGNTEDVKVSDIYCLPRRFLGVPAQAVSFSLAGVRPVSEEEGWSPQSITRFEELYNDRELLVTVKGLDLDGYPSVEIMDPASNINLNSTLIQEGFGVSTDSSVTQAAAGLGSLRLTERESERSKLTKTSAYNEDTLSNKKEAPVTDQSLSIPAAKRPSFLPYTDPVVPVQCPHSVYVSHIVSLDEFYCQLQDHSDELDKLMMLIGQHAASEYAQKIPVAFKGLPVLAKFSEDGNWYRARLTPPKDPEKSWGVVFVDYGNSESIDLANVRVIPETFLRFPFQAYECSLSNADPTLTSNEEIIDLFYELVMDKPTTCIANALNKRNGRSVYSVQIFVDNKNILLQLNSLKGAGPTVGGEASQAKEPSGTLMDLANIPTLSLVTDRRVSVIVSYIQSPLKFSCQIKESLDALGDLVSQMTRYYYDPSTPSLPVRPVLGACCAALFDQDNLWYRASVVAHDGGDNIEVSFVDYGNTELVPLKNTRVLRSEFFSLPSQAVLCRLRDIRPNMISEDLILRFESQCLDNPYQCQFESSQADRSGSGVIPCQLFNPVSGVSVSDTLISSSALKPQLSGGSSGQSIKSEKMGMNSFYSAVAGSGPPSSFESKPSGSRSSRSDVSSPTGSQKSGETGGFKDKRGDREKPERYEDSYRKKEPSFEYQFNQGRDHSQERPFKRDTSREASSRKEREDTFRSRQDSSFGGDRNRDSSRESGFRRTNSTHDQQDRERHRTGSFGENKWRGRDNSRDSVFGKDSSYRSREDYYRGRDDRGRDDGYRDYKNRDGRSRERLDRRSDGGSSFFDSNSFRRDREERGYYHKRNSSGSSQGSYHSGRGVIDPVRPSLSSPMRGRVSHVESALEFYVQPSWGSQKLASASNAIACYYGDEKRGVVLSDPTIGSYCCALIGNNYRRCQVKEVLQDGVVKVFCLDEGSRHKVSRDFYILERQFYYLSAQAVCCSLADYESQKPEDLSEITTHISDAMLGRNVEVTFRSDRHGDKYSVDVVLMQSLSEIISNKKPTTITSTNTTSTTSTSTTIIESHSSTTCIVEEQGRRTFKGAQDQFDSTVVPPHLLLSPGQEEEAMILSASSTASLFVQLLSSEETVSEITSAIETFMRDPVPHVSFESAVLRKGGVVLGQFTDDDCWYRALIRDFTRDAVNVLYIDFGNSEALPLTRVHPITEALSGYPRQTIECRLEGLEDYTPTANCVEAMECELLGVSCNLSVIRCDVTTGVHVVRMMLKEDSRDVSDWVLTSGYFTKNLSVVKEPSQETTHPQTGVSAPQENIVVPQGNISTASPEEVKEVQVSEVVSLVSMKSYPVTAGESLSVSLSYQEEGGGGKTVWVTPTIQSVEREALAEQLEEEYSLTTPNQLIPDPQTGQTCCAKYSSDGCWYRALVLAPPSPSITVLFVDYGNTDQVDSVYTLHDHLTSLPMSAICCRLEDSSLDATPAIEWDEPFSFQFLSREELPTSGLPLWKVRVSQLSSSSVSEARPSPLPRPVSPLRESNVPSLQVKEGDQYQVYISHSESPSLFYCQLVKESEDLDALMAQIADFYTDKYLEVESLPGSYCVAQYSKNNSWYRAQIVEALSRDGDDLRKNYKILFVDYGNMEIISELSMLQRLEPQFTHLPLQALPCSLLSSERESFTEEQLEAFYSLNVDEDSFLITLQSVLSSGVWLVELHDQNGTSLNDLFVSPLSSPRLPLVGGVTTPSYYMPRYLPGSNVDVFVTCVNSPDNFYCQPLGLASQLEDLMSNISEFMSLGHAPEPCPLETLETGQTCLARYTDESEWYRGEIDSIKLSERKVFVRYVDYGNLSVLDEGKVVPLPPQFLGVPVQALACSVMRPSEGEEGSKVTPTMSERFIRTVCEEEQYMLTILSCSSDKYFVDVYIGNQKINFSFLESPTSPINTASSREDELSKELEMSPFHSTDGGGASGSGLMLKMSKSPTTDLDESEEDSTATGEPLIHAPCHLSLVANEILQVSVIHVKDPSLLYVQRLDCSSELRSLSDEIAQYCSDCAGQLYQESYQSGDFVLAQYESDQTWYRAQVVQQESTDSFLLKFIDYGKTEVVSSKNMIMCPGNFLELPVQAISVSLAQVPSREGWPEEYRKYIVELTQDKELRATVILPGRQNIPASVALQDLETGLDVASKVLEELDKECEAGGASDSKLLLQEGEPIHPNEQSSVSADKTKEEEEEEKSPSSFDGEDLGNKIETLREKLELVCVKENNTLHSEVMQSNSNNNNIDDMIVGADSQENLTGADGVVLLATPTADVSTRTSVVDQECVVNDKKEREDYEESSTKKMADYEGGGKDRREDDTETERVSTEEDLSVKSETPAGPDEERVDEEVGGRASTATSTTLSTTVSGLCLSSEADMLTSDSTKSICDETVSQSIATSSDKERELDSDSPNNQYTATSIARQYGKTNLKECGDNSELTASKSTSEDKLQQHIEQIVSSTGAPPPPPPCSDILKVVHIGSTDSYVVQCKSFETDDTPKTESYQSESLQSTGTESTQFSMDSSAQSGSVILDSVQSQSVHSDSLRSSTRTDYSARTESMISTDIKSSRSEVNATDLLETTPTTGAEGVEAPPTFPTLQVGSQYKVFVVDIESPYSFVCHLSSYAPVIEALSSLLAEIYGFPERDYPFDAASEDVPAPGHLVCTRFSEDDSYYRARVLSEEEPGFYKVKYLDYGNSESLPLTRIFKLHPQLLSSSYPPFAIRCSLSDLPVEREEDKEKIEYLVDAMKGLIDEEDPTVMEVVQCPLEEGEGYRVKLMRSEKLTCNDGLETVNQSIAHIMKTASYNNPGLMGDGRGMALNSSHMNGHSNEVSETDLTSAIKQDLVKRDKSSLLQNNDEGPMQVL